MKSIVALAVLLLIFNIGNTAYNPSIALQLGYLSGASYQSAASIQAWNCSYCQKYRFADAKVFSNSISGIQGFTGFSHSLNAVVVVFRGSSNIQNWILNIGTTRSTYPLCSGCSVHSGFYSGYSGLASTVRTAVQTLRAKYRNVKLIVTGHSLGGALSILCTADLKNYFGSVDLTYTYGQPRVGNQAFVDWFQSHHPNVHRLVDYADIVPHLPPSNLGFLHSNQQVWYQRGMQSYQLCQPESMSCSNSIGTTGYSTDDHSLDNYLKLKALSQEKLGYVGSLLERIFHSNIFQTVNNLRSSNNQSDAERQEAFDQQQRKVEAFLNELRSIQKSEIKQQ